MSEVVRELAWDDEISNDGEEFVLLPEGEYPFRVMKFDRARHSGSEKLPPCNKAVITIEVEGEQGKVTLTENLFLSSKTEGLVCSFFRCIGQRKHGETLKMDWAKVPGSRGMAKISIRKWNHNSKKNEDGTPVVMSGNQVAKWLDPEEPKAAEFKPGTF
jgi:hypothetical protein